MTRPYDDLAAEDWIAAITTIAALEAENAKMREALTETAVALAGGRHKDAEGIARAALQKEDDK